MATVNLSTFDFVHDIQSIYRHLLDAMARPGKIVNIKHACRKTAPPSSFSKTMAGLAFTLLDTEVHFFVDADEPLSAVEFLRKNTYSHFTSVDRADFLFIDRLLQTREIEELMRRVKKGTLQNPHQSATIFISVDELGKGRGIRYVLKGPGIRSENELFVVGLDRKWISERKRVNDEYPMGVDIVLVTPQGDLVALPRTTSLKEGEDEWDTLP